MCVTVSPDRSPFVNEGEERYNTSHSTDETLGPNKSVNFFE